MGIFDGLFGSSLGKDGTDENGVEVKYTGGDVRHLNDNSKYGYDAKVVSDKNGNTHYYSSGSDWDRHSHDISDKDGNFIYNRSENDSRSDNHQWEDKKQIADFIEYMPENQLSYLYELSEELNNEFPKLIRKM